MSLALELLTRIAVNIGIATLIGFLAAVLLLGVIAIIHIGDRLYKNGRDRAALTWFWGAGIVGVALGLTVAGA